jgi:hypothetical protein
MTWQRQSSPPEGLARPSVVFRQGLDRDISRSAEHLATILAGMDWHEFDMGELFIVDRPPPLLLLLLLLLPLCQSKTRERVKGKDPS